MNALDRRGKLCRMGTQGGEDMEKFIPYEKLSKKKQRELDAKRRTVWTISPVTRKPDNPRAYNRKKAQKWRDDSGFCAFDFFILIFR
jgi:hypothetical protein